MKKIYGWSVDDNMQELLVRKPLEKALLKRKVQPGLIVHSDRGGQYLSDKMKELVQIFGLKQSMSRADDPYDNAFAESLWSRLKTELEIPKGGYENIVILRSILFEFIEGYYNRQRLHSSLNYEFPADFVRKISQKCKH
jgi:putative transposase